MIQNPFRPARWEHHSGGHPLIWFTPTAELLAGDKSAYVHGNRGSGKTTLLRSLCWEDLVSNPSLKLQRTLGDFQHIGIYIRFPDHVSESMAFPHWAQLFPNSPNPDLEFYRFFSLAIELICLEKALTSCHELRLRNHLELDAAQELRVVDETLEEYPALLRFDDRRPVTFPALARTMRNLVRRLNEASGRGSMGELLDLLPKREPGELLHFLTERLSGVTRLRVATGGVSPGFKFCLDDCEVLRSLQRMTVNSLVRKSKFPVSWVVTAVGDSLERGDTFIFQQPLTDADRKAVSLDARDREEFGELCQAVASMRVFFSIPVGERPEVDRPSIATFFDLKERLGTQSVNDVIQRLLGKGSSPLKDLVRDGAQHLRTLLWDQNISLRNRYPLSGERLPYYEAYLLLHWTGLEDSFVTQADRTDLDRIGKFGARLRDGSFQAWMRRKMVGALLHMAARLNVRRLPLAGANRVITLADGSIRDFLEIMAEIYDFEVTPGTDFTQAHLRFATSRSRVSSDIQTKGINKASDTFADGISAQADANPEAMVRLVEAIGKLTNRLQTNPDDASTLGRTERGLFVLDSVSTHLTGEEDGDRIAVAEMLRQAEFAGYLRTASVRRRPAGGGRALANTTAYRLHRRFAPHFRFSFRGAYEAVQIDARLLGAICREGASLGADAWLRLADAGRLGSASDQLSLPLSKDALDD